MATKENEAKKQFLRKYQSLLRKEKHLEQEIESIRSRYTGQAITYSDMPHGTDQRDLSDFAAEVDDLLRDLEATRWEAVHQYHLIASSIMDMEDDTEQELMRLKYLHDMTWEEIAVEMHYTVRWIYKLHGDALAHITIHGTSVKNELQ